MQITVVNRSTYPIADIRISLNPEEGWGENRLETTLEEGESAGIDLGEYTEEQLSAGFHFQFYGEGGQPVNPDYDPSSPTFFENGDFLIFWNQFIFFIMNHCHASLFRDDLDRAYPGAVRNRINNPSL